MSSEHTLMTHFYILTLAASGQEPVSLAGEMAVPPGARRQDIFDFLRGQIVERNPELSQAAPVCFVLEPVTV